MAGVDEKIIALRQLPVIEERLQSVKEQVIARTQEAMAMACTEETKTTVKKARAELNKEFAELERQRKEIKAAILEPYEKFEQTYAECISGPYKEADRELKSKIDSVESAIKIEREDQLRHYFAELVATEGIPWLQYEQIGMKVSLSGSMKTAKREILDKVEKVRKALELIDTMADRDEIMVEFRKTLDATEAIATVETRHLKMEELRVTEEARRERAEQEAARAAQVEQAAEETAAPIVEAPVAEPKKEPILRCTFTVEGTRDQLVALKNYMEKEHLNYGTTK